ncbi:MAG: T9SS type A sorting domain-containing protein, partial [Candidatus Cloacimonetes bacterium]|nr:T9SS type A sorting domain-containing protein [Candidatus Cloacimonadota bacterium]
RFQRFTYFKPPVRLEVIDYTPVDIITDFENNVIVSLGVYDDYNRIIKYNQFGIEQWMIDTVKPNDLAVDPEGCIYVTGTMDSDYTTIKYDQAGTQEWQIQYNGVESLSDYSSAIKLDDTGNVYITGNCGLEDYGLSCVTIKYSQSILANDENVIKMNNYLLNYPNPFNPSTTIKYNNDQCTALKIEIYNLKGQKVKAFTNLPNNNLFNQQIIWNGTNEKNQPVSSGVYFYYLKSNENNIISTNKCLLLK